MCCAESTARTRREGRRRSCAWSWSGGVASGARHVRVTGRALGLIIGSPSLDSSHIGMHRLLRHGARAAACLLLIAPAALQAQVAQRSVREEARRATATRDELEAMAAEAELIASAPGTSAQTRRDRSTDAAALRERLRTGDFQPGDRIVLRITGDPNFPPIDTLTVRPGGVLQIDRLGEIPIRGVLRAELPAHMKREVTKIVRGAAVQATSVVRIGTFGQIQRPGFYEFPSEGLLNEVLMRGGLAIDSDQHNVTVSRSGNEIWNRQSIDVALQEGITIDQLGLRGGDQILVGMKTQMNSQTIIQYLMLGFQIINMGLLIATRVR